MKNGWLMTFRSITFAQKAERLLKRAGVACVLQKTPRGLSERGCSYSLRFHGEEVTEVIALLKDNQVSFGKVFRALPTGEWEERP